MTNITFREPKVSDADQIWNLIKRCKPLDVNSKYLYILLCYQFSKTCVVATNDDSKIVGFLSAFQSPNDEKTLFVWQAAVDEAYRNEGLAQNLLKHVLSGMVPSIRNVEATVTPSNKSSLKFLQNFARSIDAKFSISPLFGQDVLEDGHEPENLVRINQIPIVMEAKT